MQHINLMFLLASLLFTNFVYHLAFTNKKNIAFLTDLIPFATIWMTSLMPLHMSSFTILKLSLIFSIGGRLAFERLKMIASKDYLLVYNLIATAILLTIAIKPILIPILFINILTAFVFSLEIIAKLQTNNVERSLYTKETMEVGFIGWVGGISLSLGSSMFNQNLGVSVIIIAVIAHLALEAKHSRKAIESTDDRLLELENKFERSVEYEAKKRTAQLADKVEYIKEKSQKDPLTKAYNRNGILNEMNGLINDSSVKIFSIALFDIDFFKAINDTKGHIIGDECLKFLSYTFMTHNRKTDILGRYGGDEFILLMPHINAPAAIEICDRLRKEIVVKSSPKFSISMGIASYPYDGRSFNELLENADKSLYKAKELGKNRVSYEGNVPILKK
ncbi:MAG: hypothetical protein BGO41_07575 [Clostridiales bacterium 38-18]|nr:MAG: hypothetical protein BGO41_07575 [Clostridiales bacterium 38-18]